MSTPPPRRPAVEHVARHRRPEPIGPAVLSAAATCAAAAAWHGIWQALPPGALVALLFAAETAHELRAARPQTTPTPGDPDHAQHP